MVSVLYRHSQDLRHLSAQNGISLKESETTTPEIGLIIYLTERYLFLFFIRYTSVIQIFTALIDSFKEVEL